MSVSLQPHVYYWSNSWGYAGGTGIAIDPTLRPTGTNTARMLLIYLDQPTGNFYIATGSLTEFSEALTGTAEVLPYIPTLLDNDDMPIAGVRLVTGTATIQWPNLYDVRLLLDDDDTAGQAPADAEYVVMSLDGTLTDERVLTAGADIDITDSGAGGNATVSVETGTFSRAGHGHLYPYSVAIYDDHVFQATGTILDFTGNINVAVTGTSVFISSTAAGGGGSTVLIYDNGVFQVTGTALSFDDELDISVTGSVAYVNVATGTFSQPGHTHYSAEVTDLQHAIPVSEDSVFEVTGTHIDFGENMNVAVTGSVVFVSSIDTQGGGGGGDLLIYDDSVFEVTGSAISFDDYLNVVVTGSIAYVSSPFSPTGFDIGARVYNSTSISITGSVLTTLPFDSERYDTDGIHSTASNTSRLTCKTAGKYLIAGGIQYAANATGVRYLVIHLNGTTDLASFTDDAIIGAGVNQNMAISTIYDLAVNDYVELQVYQNSGDALNINASGNKSPEFMMHKIDGGGNAITVYDDSAFKVTGTAISFDESLEVVATGSVAFVNYEDIGARVYNSTGISIPNIIGTEVTFDSERWDTDSIHSTVSNTGRLTCQTPGKYLITFSGSFAADADGKRIVNFLLNGDTFIAIVDFTSIGADASTRIFLSTIYDLAVSDYVIVKVSQTSGDALTLEAGANYSPEFMMQRIG
jgi:hypothetical protein